MVKDLNTEVDETKVSRINAAAMINITLENLFRDAYASMKIGDLVKWNRSLDAIWCILCGDVKADESYEADFQKIDLAVHANGSLYHKPRGFQRVSDEENQRIAKQYFYLRNKSIFLRKLQNKQGKGSAYAIDEDEDFD